MKFQDFVTVDGVPLIDLVDGRCWLISGDDVTERFIHSITPWHKKYAICDRGGSSYFTAENPETCLYADPKAALQEIINRAQKTCSLTVEKVAHKLATMGGAA